MCLVLVGLTLLALLVLLVIQRCREEHHAPLARRDTLLLYRLHWWSDSLERSLPNESVDGLIFTRFRDEVELFFFVSGKTSREFFAAAALERVR